MLLCLARLGSSQTRAAQSACRDRERGALCQFQQGSTETVRGHCYVLSVWRDGSGGAWDFDGSGRSTTLACLRDQLSFEELGAELRGFEDGGEGASKPSRLDELFAWVIHGGWQILVAVSATLCCSLTVAALAAYRCSRPEANTFMGWLPVQTARGPSQMSPSRHMSRMKGRGKKVELKAPVRPRRRSGGETRSPVSKGAQGFSYDAELQAAGLEAPEAPGRAAPVPRSDEAALVLLPTRSLAGGLQYEDEEPGTCSSASALLPEAYSIHGASPSQHAAGVGPPPSVFGRRQTVRREPNEVLSDSSGERRLGGAGPRASGPERGVAQADKWEAMAQELSCLEDGPAMRWTSDPAAPTRPTANRSVAELLPGLPRRRSVRSVSDTSSSSSSSSSSASPTGQRSGASSGASGGGATSRV